MTRGRSLARLGGRASLARRLTLGSIPEISERLGRRTLPLPGKDHARSRGTQRSWSAAVPVISDRVGVLVATATAAVLGMLFLGHKSYWLDEGYSIAFTSMPSGRFFGLLVHVEPNMALYYASLKVWRLLGDSEALVRSLSVIGFVSTMPILAAIARSGYANMGS